MKSKIADFKNILNNINDELFNNDDYDYIAKMDYNLENSVLKLIIKTHFFEKKKFNWFLKNRNKLINEHHYIKKKIYKKINLVKFLEQELPELDISVSIKKHIANYLYEKTNIEASWFKKTRELTDLESQLDNIQNEINYQDLIFKAKKNEIENLLIQLENNIYNYQSTIKIIRTKKTSLISYLFFGFFFYIYFILITINFKKFVFISKKMQINNLIRKKYLYENLLKENNHLESIKAEMNHFKLDYVNKINQLKQEQQSLLIKKEQIESIDYEIDQNYLNGFSDLRIDSNKSFNQKFKGIYVIWNKTLNKYYVGQSINVYKRLFKEHFFNGDVKNIIFAKDWYNGHKFFYKIYICQSKEQLNYIEKEFISKHDSFNNGYNKTIGNS